MNGQRRDDPRRRRKGMPTLVLDETTEQTTIREVLTSATDRIVEIRDESGHLVATLTFPTDEDDFDYEPFLAMAEREIDELKRRASDPRPGLTTREFFDSLRRVESNP
jgi:hypothetical protein